MRWRYMPPFAERDGFWHERATPRDLVQIRRQVDAALDEYNRRGRPASLHALLFALGQRLTKAKQDVAGLARRQEAG